MARRTSPRVTTSILAMVGRVHREGALDADAVADLADGEGLAEARALAADDGALEDLDALLGALDDPHVDLQRVAGSEVGDVVPQAPWSMRSVAFMATCSVNAGSEGTATDRSPARGPRTQARGTQQDRPAARSGQSRAGGGPVPPVSRRPDDRSCQRRGPRARHRPARANSASRIASSSAVRPPRASIRSGRSSSVRRRAWARRHRAMRPWSPERSTSGTAQPRNSAGLVYCGYSSSPPVSPRTTRRRPRRRCPSRRARAGRPPRGRPWPRPRPRRARSRRSRARRRPGAPAPARRRPRSGRTAARTRRTRPARAAIAWSSVRPPGPRSSSGRGGSTASTAANSGSGLSTIPAPPPKGVSSTVRWTSVAWRPQVVHPDVEHDRRPGPCPSRLWPAKPSTIAGKIVKTSMRTAAAVSRASVRRPGRGVDHAADRARGSTTKARGTRRAGLELEQVRGRVVEDRGHDARATVPSVSTTSDPMSSWTHRASGSSSCRAARRGGRRRAGPRRPHGCRRPRR